MATADNERPITRTKPLYQYEESLRKHLTKVTTAQPWAALSEAEKALFKAGEEGTYSLETHETIFYAQGGGQPFDTGYMSSTTVGEKETKFIVEAVRNSAKGRVLHFGHIQGGDSAAFKEDAMVEQHVDGARRDLNSRVHTAGHCIGLAVRRLAGQTPDLQATELKAQHYPDASFVEFKGIIDSKHRDAIQSQATQYIKDALPVRLTWYRAEELAENGVITAEGMPIVAGLNGKVRVVDIVGAGAYPCGGTHVPSCDHVGDIVVKGIKRSKGISKVSYAIKDKS